MSCAWNECGGKGVRYRLPTIVTVDEIQFGFLTVSGTIDARYCHAKGKTYM